MTCETSTFELRHSTTLILEKVVQLLTTEWLLCVFFARRVTLLAIKETQPVTMLIVELIQKSKIAGKQEQM